MGDAGAVNRLRATTRQRFAPSWRAVPQSFSVRRGVVLTILALNVFGGAIAVIALTGNFVFRWFDYEQPAAAVAASTVLWAGWLALHAWLASQIYAGKRRGYRYGSLLFGLGLVQAIVSEADSLGLLLAALSFAAIATIRNELTE